ncbi:thioredoxin/glutaredoxin-like protein [Staphylothermus marinus F1]|uniref:Thioredoxin/glutaredoxin-like protein n=1 Tax=Staphylothermus marinus (strain ATCC 43588 / DSM 3639 / JCM 9404 / F1) TaxID=399550 RepID=A3DKI5_STAMF|nr:thioredoxin/glutaredoxin [Staphylothermus marinus]ABN69145.1 thioredoxin/glutaredoxin-like protein [Staphylothermus marinus F1]
MIGKNVKGILYFHPLCTSSINVLEYIDKKPNIREKLNIIALTREYYSEQLKIIPSVPALADANNNILAIDPLEPQLVEAYVNEDHEIVNKYIPNSKDDALERFINSILASSYLTSKILVYPEIVTKLIYSEFSNIALRTRLYSNTALVEIFKNYIRENIGLVMEKINHYVPRIVSYNYLREIILVYGIENINHDTVINDKTILLWLQAKNSIGRAYMYHELLLNKDKKRIDKALNTIIDILEEKIDKYISKLLEELEFIKSRRDLVKKYI